MTTLLLLMIFALIDAAPKAPFVLILARPRTGSSFLCWSLQTALRRLHRLRATCIGEFLHPNPAYALQFKSSDERRLHRQLCTTDVEAQHRAASLHRCLLLTRDIVLRQESHNRPDVIIGKLFDYDLGLTASKFSHGSTLYWLDRARAISESFDRLIQFTPVSLVLVLRRHDALLHHVSLKWATMHDFWQSSQIENRTNKALLTLTRDDAVQIALDYDHRTRELLFMHERHKQLKPPKARLLEIDSIDAFFRTDLIAQAISVAHNNMSLPSVELDLVNDPYNATLDREQRLALLHERVANVDDILTWLNASNWANHEQKMYYSSGDHER
jgi:hypothetical protein